MACSQPCMHTKHAHKHTLPIQPPCLQFEVISPDVFDQFRTDGVLHPRVDPGFTPGEHLGEASCFGLPVHVFVFVLVPPPLNRLCVYTGH